MGALPITILPSSPLAAERHFHVWHSSWLHLIVLESRDRSRSALRRDKETRMTTTTEHRPAEAHHHTHGPSCGHLAVIHNDHVDYLHNGHLHHEDNGHYDECDTCSCPHCSDSCATCTCEDCTCPTCNHNVCSCEHCDDSCSSCTCEDCTCPTCAHAA